MEKGKEEGTLADTRDESIYVGESSTCLQERALEHQKDYKKGHEDSHMLKHWVGAHRDQPRLAFNQSYKTSLKCHVGEAIRIHLRQNTLNAVGVYN